MAERPSREQIDQTLHDEFVARAKRRRAELPPPKLHKLTLLPGSEEHRAIARACLALLENAAGTEIWTAHRRAVAAIELWLTSGKLRLVHRARGPVETALRRARFACKQRMAACTTISDDPAQSIERYRNMGRDLAARQHEMQIVLAGARLLSFVSRPTPNLGGFVQALGNAEGYGEMLALHADSEALARIHSLGELGAAADAGHHTALPALARERTFRALDTAEYITGSTIDELAQVSAYWFIDWVRAGAAAVWREAAMIS